MHEKMSSVIHCSVLQAQSADALCRRHLVACVVHSGRNSICMVLAAIKKQAAGWSQQACFFDAVDCCAHGC
jgi:hypothetical protein